MIVKQLSIFMENKTGSVADVVKLLGSNDINIRALQVADSTDFGIVRLIVDDTNKAIELAKAAGYTAKVTDVTGVIVPDRPNGLSDVLEVLKNNGIDIDYIYVFIGKNAVGAQAIIKTSDIEKTEAVLLNQFY